MQGSYSESGPLQRVSRLNQPMRIASGQSISSLHYRVGVRRESNTRGAHAFLSFEIVGGCIGSFKRLGLDTRIWSNS